jgi:hypothetical protein
MNNTETDNTEIDESFVIYGWKEDFPDRIVTSFPQELGISYFTEKLYCRGSILYGTKCTYNENLQSYIISEIEKNKVLNAYIYYTLTYRDESNHNFDGLRYLNAVHSDYLELIYKYEDGSI